ncbi:MAG TPA: hypothetical protein VNW06_11680 [Cytophagaceae bacterium]|jgi:hypothetical protein|nr:hypothetical protein [Cytophagaceae bacterium]
MELVIAMLISSVVISLTYKTYSIYIGLYGQYKKGTSRVEELSLLNKLLTTDIRNCERLEASSDGFVCKSLRNTVEYTLNEEYMIRKCIITDTFHIRILSSTLFWKDKEQTIPQQPASQIIIEGLSDSDTINYNFTKWYGSDILIQINQ